MHFPTHSVVQCTSLPLYLPLFISLSTEKQGSSTRAYLAHVSFLFVAIEMLHVLLLFLLIKTKEQGTDLAAPCCSHNHTHLRTHSIYASIQRWWLLQNTYIIQLCQLKITVFFFIEVAAHAAHSQCCIAPFAIRSPHIAFIRSFDVRYEHFCLL